MTMTIQEWFKDKTDAELVAEAQGLHQSIEVSKCFSPSDLIVYDAICIELARRGWQRVDTINFVKMEV